MGGVDTGVNEYSMMAGLVNFEQKTIFCGSTIISRNYLLTAAHCVVKAELDNTGLFLLVIRISILDLIILCILYNSAEFLIHGNFNSPPYANDIALIKTTQPIGFSLEVVPACLLIFYQTTNFVGTYVTKLGTNKFFQFYKKFT